MSTEFTRLKSAADEQKRLKLQGEARIQSLQEEQSRIWSDVRQETGASVTTTAEVQQVADSTRKEIEEKIASMKAIFEKEGVSY